MFRITVAPSGSASTCLMTASCSSVVVQAMPVPVVGAGRVARLLATGLYAVRNPVKLSHMKQETTLRR